VKEKILIIGVTWYAEEDEDEECGVWGFEKRKDISAFCTC
jgi:hypothetical protein